VDRLHVVVSLHEWTVLVTSRGGAEGYAAAHALGGQKRAREGIVWLAWMEPHMTGVGSFARHLHWHRALFHLDLDDRETALGLYDRKVHDEPSGEVRDMLNVTSLLWRIEAAGLPVGAWRWDELADVAQRRIGDHAWAFADLHYVLCLAAAGRRDELDAMLASIAARIAWPAAGSMDTEFSLSWPSARTPWG
jgi:hypothetical protein